VILYLFVYCGLVVLNFHVLCVETRVLWALLADKMSDRQHGASGRKLMTDVSSEYINSAEKAASAVLHVQFIVACEQTLWPTKKSRNSQGD